MIRRPPRSTQSRSSAASDVYKRQASLHWPAMLLVNGHGGNVTAIRGAVGTLSGEGRRCHAWHAAVRPSSTGDGAGEWTPGPPANDAHAGRTETSIMLALAPGDVRLDDAARGETRPLADIMPELRAHGVRAVSSNGVLGDPSGASAAEGERLLGCLVADLGLILDGLLG